MQFFTGKSGPIAEESEIHSKIIKLTRICEPTNDVKINKKSVVVTQKCYRMTRKRSRYLRKYIFSQPNEQRVNRDQNLRTLAGIIDASDKTLE